MTRNLCLASVGVAVLLLSAVYAQVPAPAPAQPPTPGSVEDVRAFADGLESCKTGKVATAHPLMKSFVIEHTVTGDKDATCGYVQTMPGKMTMECKFTASGRKLMAAELRASVAGGPMRGGTSMAQPEWAKECEIVTASGTRSPMVRIK
jgi:hypothetical protein